MSIIWLIIKVILFVLLGIVVLLLTGIAIILLAPIHYEVYAEKYDDLMYDIHFRYLKGIKGSFYLEDGIKKHTVSVFGKILYNNKVEEEVVEQSVSINDYNKESRTTEDKNKGLETNKGTNHKASSYSKAYFNQQKQKRKEVVSKEKVASPIAKEVEDTTNEVTEEVKHQTKDKIEEMPKSSIKEILFNPLTYRGIKHIIRAVWDIVKIIAPKEWDFEVVLGTGDPGDTGELIAKLTLLYPIYYAHGIIRGDFEKECLMGGCLMSGKFRLGQILRRLIQLYLQKDVRAFIHLILK